VHNGDMIYGYARVSIGGQSVAAQLSALTDAGAQKLFKEAVSGAKTDRQQLHRLLNALGEGDVLLLTHLDRLARSTRDLLNILATIAARKAAFRSLGDAWTDTTTAHGRLMVTVLGGLAEFERNLIRAHRRRARESESAGRETRTHAQAHPASVARSLGKTRPGHHFTGSTCSRIYSGNGALCGNGAAWWKHGADALRSFPFRE
jgi:DNA invertase Pin-like site-specific DNA recombinase